VDFPVEWLDKCGHTCSITKGYWGAKNFILADVIGYMFLLKKGDDRLPEGSKSILHDMEV